MSKRPINVEVKQKYEDEPFERMVRRFTKKAKKERIIETCREQHKYYEKPSVIRKRLKARRKKVLEKLRRENEKTS
jgi:ribosomal protein S21